MKRVLALMPMHLMDTNTDIATYTNTNNDNNNDNNNNNNNNNNNYDDYDNDDDDDDGDDGDDDDDDGDDDDDDGDDDVDDDYDDDDKVIQAMRPDDIVPHKEKKAVIFDIAVSADAGIAEELEKVEKYQDLKKGKKRLWELRCAKVDPVLIGAVGSVTKDLECWIENTDIVLLYWSANIEKSAGSLKEKETC